MKRDWILALGLATTTALGGAIAIPALAHGPGDEHGREMGGDHGGMMEMMQAFDADADGTVTSDELRTGLEGRLSEYDADGDGTLSIDEFEALHSAMIREHMVDRFQHLDNDGDGEITAEEIAAPADRMQRMQQRREQMMQSTPGQQPERGPAMMQDMEQGEMEGMMENDAADQ